MAPQQSGECSPSRTQLGRAPEAPELLLLITCGAGRLPWARLVCTGGVPRRPVRAPAPGHAPEVGPERGRPVTGGSPDGPLECLRIPTFRRAWLAVLSGNSGRFAVLLVAGWEAFRLGGGSSLFPSLVSMLLLLPTMCFGLVAGSFADRHNRARMATWGQVVNGVACLVLAGLAAMGHLNMASLLLLTAAVGAGNSVQGPAWQAMIPGLVGRERLRNAGLTSRIAQQGAELTGPALATVVLTREGAGATFLLCAAFYVVGSSLLWSLRRSVTAPAGAPAPGLFSPIAQGIGYVRHTRPLTTLLVWVGLHCSLTMASTGILPAVATRYLHGDAGAYGLLLTSLGLGAVLGPILMMTLGSSVRTGPLLVVSGFLSGLPLISLGLVHSLPVDVASAALAGGAQAVFMAGIYAANQGATTDSVRGRVASVQLSLTTGAMSLASLGWGALVTLMVPGLVLAVPGAVFVLACVPFTLRSRRIGGDLAGRAAGGGPEVSGLAVIESGASG